MRLSIIVPVYNVEKYIVNFLYSILPQLNKFVELIIINDGSSDNSLTLCEKLCLSYDNVFILTQKNKGISAARNRGLVKAKGEYIWMVDADDIVEKNAISIILSVLSKSSVDLIRFNFSKINKEEIYKEKLGKAYNGLVDVSTFCDVIKFSSFVWVYVFRKDLLKQHEISFNINLCLLEDYDFIMRFFYYVKSVYILDSILYRYRVYGESTTFKYNAQTLAKSSLLVTSSLIDFYTNNSPRPEIFFFVKKRITSLLVTFIKQASMMKFCKKCIDSDHFIELFYKTVNGNKKFFNFHILIGLALINLDLALYFRCFSMKISNIKICILFVLLMMSI